VTAAALAERPKRTKQADPMRFTLSEPKAVGKPQLLDLIAKSELARELVYSYVCAAQRKEPWAVKAQILSPFTAQYSLRLATLPHAKIVLAVEFLCSPELSVRRGALEAVQGEPHQAQSRLLTLP